MRNPIKQESPETFLFFSEYWGFIGRHWQTDLSDDAATDALIDETDALAKKYGNDPFYNDIVMAFLNKKQRDDKVQRKTGKLKEPIRTASGSIKQESPDTFAFFSEYWRLIGNYWNTDLSNETETDTLVAEASTLVKKYGKDAYYEDIMMAFLDKKQREDRKKRKRTC